MPNYLKFLLIFLLGSFMTFSLGYCLKLCKNYASNKVIEKIFEDDMEKSENAIDKIDNSLLDKKEDQNLKFT